MGNFGVLFRYEMKKILRSKFTLAAMLIMLVIAMMSGGLFSVGRQDAEIREAQMQIDGRIVDDELLADMVANSDEYGVVFRTKENVTYAGLIDFFRRNVGWGIPLSARNAEDLYEAREQNIAERMQDYRLTGDEIAYWKQKEAQVKTPFVWNYTAGINAMFYNFDSLGILSLFLAAIALSSAFSGENHHRTESMIRSTRYGRRQTYYAKLAAGSVFLFLSILILAAVYIFIIYVKQGLNGLDACIQLCLPQVAEPMTMRQAMCILLGLLMVSSVLFAVLTMVLSEWLNNSLAVMGCLLGFFFLTAMLGEQIPERLRLLSQMITFVPTTMISFRSFCELRLIGFSGYYLTAYQAAPVIYLLLAVGLFWIGKRCYRKRDVR